MVNNPTQSRRTILAECMSIIYKENTIRQTRVFYNEYKCKTGPFSKMILKYMYCMRTYVISSERYGLFVYTCIIMSSLMLCVTIHTLVSQTDLVPGWL